MTIRASKEELHRAEIKRKAKADKWKRPDQRPPYAKDAPDISVTVLLYDKELDMHGLGWFDFDMEKWGAFEDFDPECDFVWTELERP